MISGVCLCAAPLLLGGQNGGPGGTLPRAHTPGHCARTHTDRRRGLRNTTRPFLVGSASMHQERPMVPFGALFTDVMFSGSLCVSDELSLFFFLSGATRDGWPPGRPGTLSNRILRDMFGHACRRCVGASERAPLGSFCLLSVRNSSAPSGAFSARRKRPSFLGNSLALFSRSCVCVCCA